MNLLENLVAYGESHGAWDDADGYCEGSLARVLEAAVGAPRLPSVKSTTGFLCGMEFDNLAAELSFFKSLGLNVDAVQAEVPMRPGDLLVFDNLALAHGRRGSRRPGELHQRVYGHPSLSPTAQRDLRDRFLAVFGERQPALPRPDAGSNPDDRDHRAVERSGITAPLFECDVSSAASGRATSTTRNR